MNFIDTDRNKLRYNIINFVIYLIGIIIVFRLFNLQIVHGEEYRQMSNNRLTREIKVSPTRGNILDRTGNVIVGNTMGFELQLYKSKVDTQLLNQTILSVINVLEKSEDTYIDTFPIKINPFEYTLQGDALSTWKRNNNIKEEIGAEEAFYEFKEKYDINFDNIEDIRKIISIRYRMQKEGYSSTTPLIISKSINRQSMQELNERNNEFSGIDIAVKSIRDYKYRKSCFTSNRIYGKNK